MPEIQTIQAIYENGVLRPLQTLEDLPEHCQVKITIETQPQHPLLEFAGILSDEEAAELRKTMNDEFGKVNQNDW